MAGKVYFTSDLHFGHRNLCEGLRGMSADESGELIICNWNSVVDKRDKVFVLGDLSMDSPRAVLENIGRLHGSIQVVLGNHDGPKVAKMLSDLGVKVSACEECRGFLLTHMPCHPAELRFYKGNIHGHIHNQGLIDIGGRVFDYREENPEGMYFNVNTEFHGYTPVPFSEISEWHASQCMQQ